MGAQAVGDDTGAAWATYRATASLFRRKLYIYRWAVSLLALALAVVVAALNQIGPIGFLIALGIWGVAIAAMVWDWTRDPL